MSNKLGLVWRANVRMLLNYQHMSQAELGRLLGKSSSTMQGNFGNTGRLDQLPSLKTIQAIERSFKLGKGALSKPTFDPNDEPHQTPSEAAMEGLPEPQASINIPIPPDKLERILRILNE